VERGGEYACLGSVEPTQEWRSDVMVRHRRIGMEQKLRRPHSITGLPLIPKPDLTQQLSKHAETIGQCSENEQTRQISTQDVVRKKDVIEE
jgi:hypothetical protein